MDVIKVRKRVDVFGNRREELEHRLRVLARAIHQQQGLVLAVSRTTRERDSGAPSYCARVSYVIPLMHAPAGLRAAASSEVGTDGAVGLNLAQRSTS